MTVSKWAKDITQSCLHSLGYHLSLYDLVRSQPLRLAKALAWNGVTTLLDIGANSGQFASSLRQSGFTGKIISFEPVPDAHKKLHRAASGDNQWIVPSPLALGDYDGELKMNVSQNSVSSSILPLRKASLSMAPDFAYVDVVTVPCARLDSVVNQYIGKNDVIFLKLDVQGYEPNVLNGAENTLHRAVGLQIELSLLPVYENQVPYCKMFDLICSRGFSLWGCDPVFVDTKSGRMVEMDGVFFR